MVVFSDYECPICRHLDSRLRVLPDDARRGLTIVWRHFPLEGHLAAVPAARAAICAAKQVPFERVNTLLFDRLASAPTRTLRSLAEVAGVSDTAEYTRCTASQHPDSVLRRDREAGIKLGIVGTPTLLLDSAMFLGVPVNLEALVRGGMNGRR